MLHGTFCVHEVSAQQNYKKNYKFITTVWNFLQWEFDIRNIALWNSRLLKPLRFGPEVVYRRVASCILHWFPLRLLHSRWADDKRPSQAAAPFCEWPSGILLIKVMLPISLHSLPHLSSRRRDFLDKISAGKLNYVDFLVKIRWCGSTGQSSPMYTWHHCGNHVWHQKWNMKRWTTP